MNVCTYYWWRIKFLTLKFTSFCPLVLLVKVGWRQGRGLGSDEDEVLGCCVFENSAKENVDSGGWIFNLVIGGPMPAVTCLYTTRDFTANIGKSAFSLLWVAHCKDCHLVKIRRRGNNLWRLARRNLQKRFARIVQTHTVSVFSFLRYQNILFECYLLECYLGLQYIDVSCFVLF